MGNDESRIAATEPLLEDVHEVEGEGEEEQQQVVEQEQNQRVLKQEEQEGEGDEEEQERDSDDKSNITGVSTEPLLESVQGEEDEEDPEQQQQQPQIQAQEQELQHQEQNELEANDKPDFGLIVLTCLFRLVFVLLYLFPCRPQNNQDSFNKTLPHVFFMTAPIFNFISVLFEICAGGLECCVYTSSSIATLLIFIGGFVYAEEIATDNLQADALWIIGGSMLGISYIYDAISNLRRGWNLVAISKIFGLIGSSLFVGVGFIGPLESTSEYDYFTLRNLVFGAGIFFLAHVFTLLTGQKVNILFVMRD